jgi:hypothetical protein
VEELWASFRGIEGGVVDTFAGKTRSLGQTCGDELFIVWSQADNDDGSSVNVALKTMLVEGSSRD